MEPLTMSPLLGITQYWTTLLMNFITADGICVMYPTLTFALVGLINPAWLDKDGNASEHVSVLIKKYTERGFELYIRHDAVPPIADRMVILDTSADPWKLRHARDSDCFSVSFGPGPLRAHLSRPIYPDSPLVFWELGGWQNGLLTHGAASVRLGPPGVLTEHWTYRASADNVPLLSDGPVA